MAGAFSFIQIFPRRLVLYVSCIFYKDIIIQKAFIQNVYIKYVIFDFESKITFSKEKYTMFGQTHSYVICSMKMVINNACKIKGHIQPT